MLIASPNYSGGYAGETRLAPVLKGRFAFAITGVRQPDTDASQEREARIDGERSYRSRPAVPRADSHSVMILSDHSTRDTKIVGLPNFAPHWLKSVSTTPLARQQAPQA